MLISLEGLDLSGKSTQAKILVDNLRKAGNTVVFEHFPRYDKPIGSIIQKVLKGEVQVEPLPFQMLYVADQLDANVYIKECISEGMIVVLDRYDLSTMAFALATTDASVNEIGMYQQQLLVPDLTFLFDMPVSEIAIRKGVDPEEALDMHEKDEILMSRVRGAYKSIEIMNQQSQWHDRDIVLIDATLSIDEITKIINSEVNKKWAI